MKHDPVSEYRGCLYRNRRNPDTPAAFHIPCELGKDVQIRFS